MSQHQVLNLHYDQPLVVKLDFGPEGSPERPGTYGPQVMYTCNDDRNVIFVPPGARDAILNSGAQAGDTVRVQKFRRGKETVFAAQVMSDADEQYVGDPAEFEAEPEEPEPAPRPRIAPRHNIAAARKNGPNVGQRAYYQPSQQQQPGPQRVTQQPSAPRPAASQALARRSNPFAESMRYAVDIALEAQAYAADLGLELRFTSEDVRAFLLSHYIDTRRGGGSR